MVGDTQGLMDGSDIKSNLSIIFQGGDSICTTDMHSVTSDGEGEGSTHLVTSDPSTSDLTTQTEV